MTIEITKKAFDMLKWLGKNYYSIPGKYPPVKPEDIVQSLIQRDWNTAHPPEYQTTGFERQ